MKRPVDVLTATGQARNFIYACHICHGYNPLDHVFWRLMKSAPPSDEAWDIIKHDIVAKLSAEVQVPEGFSI